MTTRKILGPVSRVEGDLEIELQLEDQVITDAFVKSTVYRGFEEMLVGRSVEDAMVLTPRICGICSVSQSVATAKAIANSVNLEVPNNGQIVTNLLHTTEVVADLFTHFYLFFMPDFCHYSYQQKSWYEQTLKCFEPVKGTQYRKAIKARARFLHIMGILGGKWPHTLAIQPGGTTKSLTLSEIIQLKNILAEFRQFIQTEVFGCTLEQVANSQNMIELNNALKSNSDFGQFLRLSNMLDLNKLGLHQGGYLSFGDTNKVDPLDKKPGTYFLDQLKTQKMQSEFIFESLDFSYYEGISENPAKAIHHPNIEKANAYSWTKAARYHGQPMEVGAISRAIHSDIALVQDLEIKQGANAQSRIILRLRELASLLIQMDHWLSDIQTGQPYINDIELPSEGEGQGLIEAARGSLGHWLKYKNNKISHYQIIAPTTWNFSPRDHRSLPGPLEQALVGINVETDPQQVQHVIRSFDPCMQCTVH